MKTYTWDDATDDPIMTELREIREEMAREAGYDLHTLCERLREAEKKHPERFVSCPGKKTTTTSS